ncbi:hypothetical protein U5640_36240 [Streptomyces sp. SS7]|uniref:hypothetical protein n=1 Tax=Streptomyces sp. SS7 TaxID=3108485 RepID=UPI0030EEAD94
MTRADRRTLVRQLRAEGLSQRAIAKRLDIGKDTVRRDLEADSRESGPDDAPQDAPPSPDAPQVSAADPAGPAPQDAPSVEPVGAGAPDSPAPGAPLAQLPRRVSAERIEIDPRRRPGLSRDLAVLAAAGFDHEEAIDFAVRALAMGYKQGIEDGEIRPGRFLVLGMRVAPERRGPAVPRRPQAAPAASVEGA